MFTRAITRIPAATMTDGITSASLGTPDYKLALKQHQAYIDELVRSGLEVEQLPADPRYPDGHFVEDAAVVFPELAIITRPGAQARRGETLSIIPELNRFRSLRKIIKPATLDGGDVLVIGKTVYIGLTGRTNQGGFDQFAQIVSAYGYYCYAIEVSAGLHLKSSVNHLGGETLLITAELANRPEWRSYQRIIVPSGEEYAANTLWINDRLLTPAGFPDTLAELKKLDLPIMELPLSEMQKMDGGLTCLSLRF